MRGSLQVGIKMKMTLTFSVIFILLSFGFNLLGYRRIRQVLIEADNLYLLSRATSLLDKTEINPVIIPLPDKNTFIRIAYRSGGQSHILFQSPGILTRIPSPAVAGVTDTLGMRVAYVRNKSDEYPAELTLAMSGDALKSDLDSLFGLLFISSTLSVLLAGLVSYWLARQLLRPLQRIIDTARSNHSNKWRNLVPISGSGDELEELSTTINEMLVRIDESVQQQQNFFASASHELKTPLAILRAELELGLKKPNLAESIRHLLLSQLEEIRRLQEIVGEFLVVSQLKAGALIIYPSQFDLSAVVMKAFNQLMPLLEQKNIQPEIRFDEQAADFLVSADEDKIRIVLLNLLENAIKYGEDNSTITCKIDMLTSSKAWRFFITNRIRPEKLDTTNLEKAFFRIGILPNGAGLGLWLCAEIVRLHGGKMELTSQEHQFGVSITIPL